MERFVHEPPKGVRGPFARDRARVLHCAALRRLAAKTQVLTAGESDIPRTRLTHTLEVAQIAREIGAALGADPDLVELAGLSHDIGHPPFGHNGEAALNDLAASCGGFEGNAQSLRVLVRLEAKVRGVHGEQASDLMATGAIGRSVGLNLTRASLDACTKYPWARQPGQVKFGVYADDRDIFDWFRADAPQPRARCIEAQVMDWADDVAYSVHDLEDAILLGHLDLRQLASATEREQLIDVCRAEFTPQADPAQLRETLDQLLAMPLWPAGFDGSHRQTAAVKMMTSQLIGRFSQAAQEATLAHHGPGPVTRYSADLRVPEHIRREVALLKSVAVRYVMRRPGAARTHQQQRELLTEVVWALMLRGGRALEPWLAEEWERADSDSARLRVVLDQVASLTDVSIRQWHARLCR